MAAAPAVPVAAVAGAATEPDRRPFLILAPHASYRVAPFVRAAVRLGLAPVVASEGSGTLAAPDTEAIRIDFSNESQALALLQELQERRPFAGVLGTDDLSAPLAAAFAQRSGLRCNPPASVSFSRRKDWARVRLRAAGVRVPRFEIRDRRTAHATRPPDIPFPVVLKPVAMSASRGVMRADDAASWRTALARLGAILDEVTEPEESAYVLVEQFIPGFEVALEGLLQDSQLTVLAVFDKPDPLDGPYFEETYYITPSRLTPEVQRALACEVQKACAAYGLREGAVHAECRVNSEGVWILEVAARTIGGLCGRLLRFGTGRSLEEVMVAHAVGHAFTADTVPGAAGVLMLPIPRAGILSRVEGVLSASRVPYIEDLEISVREGYELVPLPEGASYLGFVFARGPTIESTEQALRSAHAHLRIVVQPLWKAHAAH